MANSQEELFAIVHKNSWVGVWEWTFMAFKLLPQGIDGSFW